MKEKIMRTIEYIKTHGIAGLEKKGIKVKEYPNYYMLNYDQINSSKFDPIVQECRSLIIDKSFSILSRAFDRFYNLGENPNEIKAFDYCLEKLDGSLISQHWNKYKKRWNFSTRSMAHAEGETSLGNTFYQVIKKALDMDDYEVQIYHNHFNRDFTYIYELVSPETRIVTRYENYELYLLAIRETKTGSYLPIDRVREFADYNGIRTPKLYRFDSFESIIEAAKDLPALEEGYVCCKELPGGKVGRIKVKNPSYVAIAHLRDNGLSIRRIIDLVLENDQEEYLTYFPEDRELFNPYIKAMENMFIKIAETHLKVKDIVDNKDFALVTKDISYKHFLFSLRRNKEKPKEFFTKLNIKSKLEQLKPFMDNKKPTQLELLEDLHNKKGRFYEWNSKPCIKKFFYNGNNYLDKLERIPQSPKWHPEGNVFNHTLLSVKKYYELRQHPDFIMFLAVLYHDIGKITKTQIATPESMYNLNEISTYDGSFNIYAFKITSYGHDIESGKIIRTFSFLPDDIREKVAVLAENHMAPTLFYNKAKRKGFNKLATKLSNVDLSLKDLHFLSTCDILGRGNGENENGGERVEKLDWFKEKSIEYGVFG